VLCVFIADFEVWHHPPGEKPWCEREVEVFLQTVVNDGEGQSGPQA